MSQIEIKGKCLWIVQITNPEQEPNWKDKTVIETIWRNRGIGAIAETLQGALNTVVEQFPKAKLLSINKHTNQIYIERTVLSEE